MVDGIFYVKASGNMNRTIIKALNAHTGKEIFETEKAKNSGDLSNQFNPFMIDANNNRLIDVVSKGIYVFDAKTGKKISYTTTKDLGVGTVKFSEFHPNGLLRSEEHTSELQSRPHLVCRLLLEKKKKKY